MALPERKGGQGCQASKELRRKQGLQLNDGVTKQKGPKGGWGIGSLYSFRPAEESPCTVC